MQNNTIIDFIEGKGWEYELRGEQAYLEVCPLPGCGKENQHFTININSGKFFCFKCNQSGTSLNQLQYLIGDRIHGITALKDSVKIEKKPLPDYEKFHKDLYLEGNSGALDYLVCERGFSFKTIEEQKLGVTTHYFDKPKKECRCISIPYFQNGKCIFIKFRTLPPEVKDFITTPIEDVPLYNQDIIKEGMEELLLVESETGTIALKSAGYETVVGVPGAGIKKSNWINQVEKANPKRIYLLYDNDSKGQEGARDISVRLGRLDSIYNIKLPEFEKADKSKGKDINEFLRLSGGYEKFLELKDQAKPFEIHGVSSLIEVLDNLEQQLKDNNNIFKPTLDTPWPSLNKLVKGFEYGDVVGVTAIAKCGKSTLSLNWLDYYAKSKGLNAFFYCLEMSVDRVVRKWISMSTGVKEEDFNLDTLVLSKEIIKNMPGNYLFGFTAFKKVDEIFEVMYQAKKRYGLNVISFDNLHLLTRSQKDRASEIDSLSKRMKQIAMELNILLILIMQPTKIQKGEIVSIYDSRGSAALVQDVDFGLSLHRNKSIQVTEKDIAQLGQLDTEEAFDPQMLVKADACRYAPGGSTTLWFNGELSQVTEMLNNGVATPIQEYERKAISV